MGLSAPIGSC